MVLSYESQFPTTLSPSSGGNSHSESRLGARERAKIKVTPEQHEVIIGSLLGDIMQPDPLLNGTVDFQYSSLTNLTYSH